MYLYYYQNAWIYSVHATRPQRAHGALEDTTALPQRPHSALFNTLYKRQAGAGVMRVFKINAAAWRSRRCTASSKLRGRRSGLTGFYSPLND